MNVGNTRPLAHFQKSSVVFVDISLFCNSRGLKHQDRFVVESDSNRHLGLQARRVFCWNTRSVKSKGGQFLYKFCVSLSNR